MGDPKIMTVPLRAVFGADEQIFVHVFSRPYLQLQISDQVALLMFLTISAYRFVFACMPLTRSSIQNLQAEASELHEQSQQFAVQMIPPKS